MLTIAEAAHLLGLSERRVRELCSRGELRAEKSGRVWALQREDVERFGKLAPGETGRPQKL